MHEEEQHHGGLAELYEHRSTPLARLYLSIGITAVGMAVEVVGGVLSGSIALLSDAGHMFTHIFALGISAFAVKLAQKEPCHHRTFGLLRAEVLAAYTNAIALFGVVAFIIYESVMRLLDPVEIRTGDMLIVAAIGLVVNLLSIALLAGHNKNISVRSAVAHMMADTLSSVVIVIGALVIARTSWTWLDPILSAGIALVILRWAWVLFKDTSRILMEAAPEGITTNAVEDALKEAFPEVRQLSKMRIWSITEGVSSLTAVVSITDDLTAAKSQELLTAMGNHLTKEFGFTETTLQIAAAGDSSR